MPTRSLSLPGRETSVSEDRLNDFFPVEVIKATEVDAATRGTPAENKVKIEGVHEKDVIEVTFDNGTRQWWSVDQLETQITRGSLRGEAPVTRPGEIEIPSIWVKESTSRGLGELAGKIGAKLVKVLRPNLDQAKDIVAGKAPDLAARAIAEYLEKKIEAQLNPKGPGLYKFSTPQLLSEQLAAKDQLTTKDLNTASPYLLFLHGTASSSTGSFSGLGVRHGFDSIGIQTTPEWDELQNLYKDRVLAYEHRTLSQSPLENAIAIATVLPAGTRLHLVSHSRGGLVGELLCLGQAKLQEEPGGKSKLQERLLLPFEKAGRAEDIRNLKKLLQLLAAKNLRVERFVRVACPARGTKLASQKINDFFSGIFNLMSYIPGLQAHPSLEFIRSTIVALLQYPTDAQKLPGIEAMMPESPFIQMLNDPVLRTDADLAVIKGDIQPGGLFDRVKLLPIELLFREDNDLVVNTRAMTGGMKREPGYQYFDHGQEVSHFNYFQNQKTRTRLVGWLKTDKADAENAKKAGFEPIQPAPAPEKIGRGSRGSKPENLPLVFVVPGIMGSHLSVAGDPVWLDPISLAWGEMGKLHIGAEKVVPTGLVEMAYKDLVNFLKEKHEVVPFPFDWRKSLRVSADLLKDKVEQELKQPGRKIKFLAHSMGGLVVRTMIAKYPSLWDRLRERDCQFVMLGTPNRGSFVINQILAGKEKTLTTLAAVDLKHDKGQLIDMIRWYDGMLEMLPDDFLQEEAWRGLSGIYTPDFRQLKHARELRANLDKVIDRNRMIYVAGTAPSTPFEMIRGSNFVDFKGTTDGDGRVTYKQGLLEGVKTWYVNAAHGDLSSHRDSFDAYAELLSTGMTSRLSTSPILQRGTAEKEHLIVEEELQMHPDEQELIAAALGKRVIEKKETEAHTLQISVVHTHLQNARYPIAVGHYRGDQIVGAERVIDRLLDSRLSQLSRVNLYPGDEGTVEVIRMRGKDIPGALIVGLGEFGQANEAKIINGITAAALRYALMLINDRDGAEEGGEEESLSGPMDASISSLLLGTYSNSTFNAADSLNAIVQGVIKANRILKVQGLWDRVRINTIEITELYEDIATQAVRAAWRIVQRPPTNLAEDERLRLEPEYLVSRDGGQPQRPLDLYSQGWSRKIRIALEEDRAMSTVDKDAPAEKRLSFTVFSERARSEEKLLPTQYKLVGGLIKQAVTSSEYSSRLGVTLFELLVPNNFKDQIGSEGDLLLYVDSESAQYPWELLAERNRESVTPVVIGRNLAGRGMIRQLATSEFRSDPQSAQGGNVLIVGDPNLENEKFQQLDGAREEAGIVARAFDSRADEYKVFSKIGANAYGIINSLFERDYRIIHLAGHGMYDEANPSQSGMILGNGMRLTAMEIGQLRVVPDLVFINCCYLGLIDRKPEANKLAASISLELIKMGVKAVVAAGWEVDDAAAKTFAETFYACMLDKVRFGDAVKSARTRVYRDYPNSNTWGAYQCYGDPDFVLAQNTEIFKSSQSGRRLFSKAEYRDELKRTIEVAKKEGANSLETYRARLEELRAMIPRRWLDGEMLANFGDVWGEFKEFDVSIEYFERALNHEKANLTLQQIQKYANILTRYAKELYDLEQAGQQKSRRGPAPRTYLTRSLQCLNRLKQISETSELHSLFGGHYKRRAQILGNPITDLERAARHYEIAGTAAREKDGQIDVYSSTNWLTCQFLLATLRRRPAGKSAKTAAKTAKDEASLRETLKQVLARARDLSESSDNLWDRVYLPDAMLLQHLFDNTLAEGHHVQELVRLYTQVLKEKATIKECDTVADQFDFLVDMLRRSRGRHEDEIDLLKGIGDAIRNPR